MKKTEMMQFRVTADEKKEILELVKKRRFQDVTEMVLFLVFNTRIHCDVGFQENITGELGIINNFYQGRLLTAEEFSRAKETILKKYEVKNEN